MPVTLPRSFPVAVLCHTITFRYTLGYTFDITFTRLVICLFCYYVRLPTFLASFEYIPHVYGSVVVRPDLITILLRSAHLCSVLIPRFRSGFDSCSVVTTRHTTRTHRADFYTYTPHLTFTFGAFTLSMLGAVYTIYVDPSLHTLLVPLRSLPTF